MNASSYFLILSGLGLTVIAFLLTLFVTTSKDTTELNRNTAKIWLKSISIISSCLALFAAGSIIKSISVHMNIRGDNNSVSIRFNDDENIKNNPDSILIKESTSPDYEVVDDFAVGWADSNGGRNAYTLEQVNSGVLDDTIVFNSISDGKIGHEFNFVGARENNGDTNAYYKANEIEVEEGKTYLVRLYVHNNSRIPTNVAKDTRISFTISDTKYVSSDELYEAAIHGYIKASNSNPKWVSDGVKFTSDRSFRLVYIIGTALFNNVVFNNIGNGGFILSDSIVGDWVTIGYDKMDGRIPACYEYDSVTTIKVMPVFEDGY